MNIILGFWTEHGIALRGAAVEPEQPGARPRYMPGDVFLAKDGTVGVITEAKWSINGCSRNWNEEQEHAEIRHSYPPKYAGDRIPGFKSGRVAWWVASEWQEVCLGPLHSIVDRK